jgi:hypothetical protein
MNHQPAPQLTKAQEAYVLRKMMEHARSLPAGTSTVETAQQLRSLKPQWIREAVRRQDSI